MTCKRIKRITSHAGHARYLATVNDTDLVIPRVKDIPSPYAYSPTHTLYQDERGRFVFIVETSHRQYDVFEHPSTLASERVSSSDSQDDTNADFHPGMRLGGQS